MKRWLILMGCLGLCLGLLSCAKQDIQEDRPPLIGISFDTFVVERWQRELEILVASLTELGADVDVQIANENQKKQIDQIKYLIDQKVDVLIVVPNDAYALTDVIEAARREGIKVISYDRLILNAYVDVYISFDNEDIGMSMTTKLIETLMAHEAAEPYQVLMVNGDPKDYNATMLREGSLSVLDPFINAGQIHIADSNWAHEWREQYAKDLVESYLSQGHTVHGIIAANDVLATGVIEVLSKWQLIGEVAVVSQDAELSACQRIVEGSQLATVYKPITDLAITAAHLAMKLAMSEPLDIQETIYNGYRETPYLKMKATVIDKENIDEAIIDSGFHRREDVYLNIMP